MKVRVQLPYLDLATAQFFIWLVSCFLANHLPSITARKARKDMTASADNAKAPMVQSPLKNGPCSNFGPNTIRPTAKKNVTKGTPGFFMNESQNGLHPTTPITNPTAKKINPTPTQKPEVVGYVLHVSRACHQNMAVAVVPHHNKSLCGRSRGDCMIFLLRCAIRPRRTPQSLFLFSSRLNTLWRRSARRAKHSYGETEKNSLHKQESQAAETLNEI